MAHRIAAPLGLALLICLALEGQSVQAQNLFFRSRNDQWERVRAAAQVPWDKVPPELRDKVKQLLDAPTMFTHGPSESVVCQQDVYRWLLDNPDRATHAWRRLGAICVAIHRKEGSFYWSDERGSHITWQAIHSGPNLRIWYAEGEVKPGSLFPMVPVRCVVLLRHDVLREHGASVLLEHQADVFVHTDSKVATMVMRMMGPSAPRLAEQGVGQLQMFFSALAWYVHQHPQKTEELLGMR